MLDAILYLSAYGLIIRTLVEMLRKVFSIEDETWIKGLVVLIAAGGVYLLGLDPAALFGMGKVKDVVVLHGPVNVALLANAAMGTHDVLEVIRQWGEKR